ncbi:hypothetical protein AX17_003012 [Amanita inopinata Kibby_2008]|nr:hypothetical protein AX17_003012 [Amanita inopinata Kibby_2008]
MSKSNILFLRAPQPPDRYESAFLSGGYTPVSIPVLETALVNVAELAGTISKGPEYHGDDAGCTGVIVTSARACEAWKAAVKHLVDIPSSSPSPAGSAELCAPSPSWSTIPFYVVGQATASALTDIHAVYSPSYPQFVPSPMAIRGSDSGNAEELARFIVRDVNDSGDRPHHTRRLLYLTGDKNRDTLPTILQSAGISLNPVQVYATRGSSTFAHDLAKVLESQVHTGPAKDWWIVYFAPSAAQFVTPILEDHFTLPRIGDNSPHSASSVRLPTRLAAIGPTTLNFLQDTLHLRVDATASKPRPEDLLSAIGEADQRYQ